MQYACLESGVLYRLLRWSPQCAPEYGCNVDTHGYAEWKKRLVAILGSRYVQTIWVVAVCLSTGLAMAEQPHYDLGRGTYIVFFTLQTVCLAFFWIRMLADCMTNRLDYFKAPCNWIELVVNMFGVLQLIPPTHHIRWMRAWAAARPLRHLLALPVLRNHWRSAVHSTLFTADLFVIGVGVLFFFATIAVSAFGDALQQRCTVTSVSSMSPTAFQSVTLPYVLGVSFNASYSVPCGLGSACPTFEGTSVMCEVSNGTASTDRFYHFRNVGASLLIMLKVASADRWYDDLESLMSAKGSGAALFYVTVLVCLFPIACWVIGAVFHFYTRCASGCAALDGPQETKTRGTQTEERHALSRSCLEDSIRESTALPKRLRAQLDDPSFLVRTLAPTDCKAFSSLQVQPLSKYRTLAGCIVRHPMFVVTELVLSLLSVIVLAVLYESMQKSTKRRIMIAHCIVSLAFLVRVLLYGAAFGMRMLTKDVFAYFDLAGALVGVLELAVPALFEYSVVRGLRCFRAVHFFKYTPSFLTWRSLCQDLGGLFFFVACLHVLYALGGMELFGNDLLPCGTFPCGSFSTIWSSLLLTFSFFTGSNWYGSLLALFTTGKVPSAVLFVVSILGWQYLVIVPLAYSIILYRTRQASYRAWRAQARTEKLPHSHPVPPLMEFSLTQGNSFDDDKKENPPVTRINKKRGEPVIGERYTDQSTSISKVRLCGVFSLSLQRFFTVMGNSLWFIPPRNVLRKWLILFFQSFMYQFFSFLTVALSTVALFFERAKFDGEREDILHRLNVACIVIFGSEMVLKWLAYGLVFVDVTVNPFTASLQLKPYLRVSINYFDLTANVFSFAGLFYKPLRIGRVVRTVRLLTSQERPSASLLVLSQTLPHSLKAFPLVLACYIWFALLGAQFFSGRLWFCRVPNTMTSANQTTCMGMSNITQTVYLSVESGSSATVVQNLDATRGLFHYDHFGQALLSVFVFTTTGDWSLFMYDGTLSRTGTLSAPSLHAGYYVGYFVVILLLFRYYLFYLVAAALVSPFSYYKNRMHKVKELTVEQLAFQNTFFGLQHVSGIRERTRPLRGKACGLVHGLLVKELWCGAKCVDVLLFAYHVVNCGFIAAWHVHGPTWLQTTLDVLNYISIVLCAVEVLLHLTAYGGIALCHRRVWFSVVLLTLMIAAACSVHLHFLQSVRFLKLLTTGAFFGTVAPLQRRFSHPFTALCLYLIVLLVYSVVGTVLFGDAQATIDGVSTKQNFRTVIGSFLVLFTSSSLGSWERIMTSLYTTNSGGVYAAVVYFVTFIVVSRLVVVQLIVVCLLDIFSGQIDFDAVMQCVELRRMWASVAGSHMRLPLSTVLSLMGQLSTFVDRTSSVDRTYSQRSPVCR
ncbi:voltage-dependent calcium channel alpha 1, invertebrate [Strigomonas culicis]|uniref:Voltage-dependent calcium channel alpha 1, invertebrate n=1 Tax=Strigomonas culicis TaxID=28005 RepID=S9U8H3_9TRYP|nr:voltage-dependent calcium channel alpha 1, invertebrate [Strigomonas culicis]|eukprot:EPY25193.1 voltage-dependent calcium channel alpha 1, invertebrate [Strigomonas culicis]